MRSFNDGFGRERAGVLEIGDGLLDVGPGGVLCEHRADHDFRTRYRPATNAAGRGRRAAFGKPGALSRVASYKDIINTPEMRLSVYILPVTGFDYIDNQLEVFDGIDDPIMALRTRYLSSWPESFSQPGGRGFPANVCILPIIRWRSVWKGMASISLIADGLIRILYFPTPFQLPNDLFKVAILLLRALTKAARSSASSERANLTAWFTISEIERSPTAAFRRKAR